MTSRLGEWATANPHMHFPRGGFAPRADRTRVRAGVWDRGNPTASALGLDLGSMREKEVVEGWLVGIDTPLLGETAGR